MQLELAHGGGTSFQKEPHAPPMGLAPSEYHSNGSFSGKTGALEPCPVLLGSPTLRKTGALEPSSVLLESPTPGKTGALEPSPAPLASPVQRWNPIPCKNWSAGTDPVWGFKNLKRGVSGGQGWQQGIACVLSSIVAKTCLQTVCERAPASPTPPVQY